MIKLLGSRLIPLNLALKTFRQDQRTLLVWSLHTMEAHLPLRTPSNAPWVTGHPVSLVGTAVIFKVQCWLCSLWSSQMALFPVLGTLFRHVWWLNTQTPSADVRALPVHLSLLALPAEPHCPGFPSISAHLLITGNLLVPTWGSVALAPAENSLKIVILENHRAPLFISCLWGIIILYHLISSTFDTHTHTHTHFSCFYIFIGLGKTTDPVPLFHLG